METSPGPSWGNSQTGIVMANSISRSNERPERKHKSPELLCALGVLTARPRGLPIPHPTPSQPHSPGLLALTGNNSRAQQGQHSAALPQHGPSRLPACLPAEDSPARAGRIMEQWQADLLVFLLSPPNGNNRLGGFPCTVPATPLQILQPLPDPIPHPFQREEKQ